MNESFKDALKNSGMSMYSLAKKSGLPYTTVNRLVNDKLDINDCNSAAVREMSKVLGVTMEQLVDKYDFLTGTEGEYLGVKYKWTRDEDDHQVLLLNDNGCDLLVWKGRLLIDVNRIDSYMAIVRLMVDELILQNESKALLVEARRKYARTPAI